MNPKIIEEESINMYDLYKEIKIIKKRDEELNIRAKKTEEYLQDFASLKMKEAEDLKKDLLSLEIPRLKLNHIDKIIDVLPDTPEEVKIILQGYTITVSKENSKKIADAVAKYTVSV